MGCCWGCWASGDGDGEDEGDGGGEAIPPSGRPAAGLAPVSLGVVLLFADPAREGGDGCTPLWSELCCCCDCGVPFLSPLPAPVPVPVWGLTVGDGTGEVPFLSGPPVPTLGELGIGLTLPLELEGGGPDTDPVAEFCVPPLPAVGRVELPITPPKAVPITVPLRPPTGGIMMTVPFLGGKTVMVGALLSDTIGRVGGWGWELFAPVAVEDGDWGLLVGGEELGMERLGGLAEAFVLSLFPVLPLLLTLLLDPLPRPLPPAADDGDGDADGEIALLPPLARPPLLLPFWLGSLLLLLLLLPRLP